MPDSNGSTVVHVELDASGVARVTLDRAHRLNAINAELSGALSRALAELGENPRCRAIVLSGAGRAFCSGLDLAAGLTAEDDGDDPMTASYVAMRRAVSIVTTMREIPQPVIAAVRGHAVGAGFAIAAAADIRVCAPDAVFNAVFTSLGVSAGDLGLSWLLPRLISPGHAAEIFYTADVLTASDGVRLGFVQHISDDPVVHACTIADRIASKPPLGIQMTKRLLDASLGAGGFREHLEHELRSQILGLHSTDHAKAVHRFVEHRRADTTA
ncbi:enoyl-CoA hydratase/isomerase family protein [Gordonia rubripertincta]|uniref:Enoyl-CoA hydratase/isomerase family protein n=1 Tax=Gordonia rubripertincta TaxID=36822 RepID=A0AAW4FZ69_GORRU|nr:enoyl-CoA hydratase/isomerase family protein [Gordonia rubripertincta]MBM7276364.1 enoyl-CoA hydratase/isomerase family protein [Gordonia rubripertincta]